MKDNLYAFGVARIRALENKLLTKQDIAALINQRDLPSALSYLSQKGYADANDGIDTIIRKHGEELRIVLEESVPDKAQLGALYILNDYFNIKVMVKCSAENTSAEKYFLFPTTISLSDFDLNAPEKSFSFLKDEYRNIAKEAFNTALKSKNGKYSDALIDKAAIDALCSYSERKNSGLLGEICAFLADTANIKTALRCSATNQDSDFINAAIGKCSKLDREKLVKCTASGFDELQLYLETTAYKKGFEIYRQKPSAFEKWCDDEVMNITKSAIYTSFGFAPVVSYFYRKNLEIKTVRMILSALKSDIDKDIIKERVRALYA